MATTHSGWMDNSVNRQHHSPISTCNKADYYTELEITSPTTDVTTPSTHCSYPWKDGQAEL